MLKNLKSWFIVEEEGKPTDGETSRATPAASRPAAPTTPRVATNEPTPSTPSRAGKVTNKFTEVLLRAMDRENLEGFDYLEYKRSLMNLKKMDMDEATRYKSAFAMAQTMQATPPHLIQTAQHYLDVLKQEEGKFGQALAGQRQKQIGDKEARLEQMATQIADKEEKIRKLQAEIETARQKIQQVQSELKAAQTKVVNTQGDFMASYQNLVGQIQQDIDKMKTYLK